MNQQQIITELQSQGLRLVSDQIGATSRKGGAGPSDHKAITVGTTTVMVPIYKDANAKNVNAKDVNAKDANTKDANTKDANGGTQSDYTLHYSDGGTALLERAGIAIAPIQFPPQPQFYSLKTADGIPYHKIALLHGQDVLATTVQQTCMRYRDSATACQFCAIEESLKGDRTIIRKTPEQLAEVAEAAVRLDGIKHMVMTTGTPNRSDRGAAYLADCATAIKAVVDIPIQAQCEPPDDFGWFENLKAAGVDSFGMHLEAVNPEVRSQIMPGKAEVPVEYYFEAFEAAVKVFGRGQVSTYLLAGLGDSLEDLVKTCDRLIQVGVYPFVVPFVPLGDTPLAQHPSPSSTFMYELYQQVGTLLKQNQMSSKTIKAGCGKCGACSALSSFE